ncbi:MAG: hypothetical protein M1819_006289 [Sarea resinae]|nr:MAG: hypothetical protein M1819_006289 [Sarea resinae]
MKFPSAVVLVSLLGAAPSVAVSNPTSVGPSSFDPTNVTEYESSQTLVPVSYANKDHALPLDQQPSTSNTFSVRDVSPLIPTNPTAFWLGAIEHNGTSPFLKGDSDYKVFRNVQDYSGETDDARIQAAIDDQGRCGGGECDGFTGRPAQVYLPGGTYTITRSLQLYVMTQFIGDPLDMPILKADSGLSDVIMYGSDGVLQSSNNFYISIRNVIFDTTNVDSSSQISCLNWAVGQGTSLDNVQFRMPSGSQHTGLSFLPHGDNNDGGGSGIIMSDLTFVGGLIGIRLKGQQWTFKNLNFTGCSTGLAIKSVIGATVFGGSCQNTGICIDASNQDKVGGITVVDFDIYNSKVGIKSVNSGNSGWNSIVIDNLINEPNAVSFQTGNVTLHGDISAHAMGNIYKDNSANITTGHKSQTNMQINRPGPLLVNGAYYMKPLPNFQQYSASQFASVKGMGAQGDGSHDDTAAINAALEANSNKKITYFPHGVYIVTDTIKVPPGSIIVGEWLSAISASGRKFEDATNPRVLFQVGEPNDQGTFEMTDMVFTTADILAGAILMEINIAGNSPGDVSLHNCHFRIGGTADSRVNEVCDTTPAQCQVPFMMLHITATGSPYIENMWGWAADHSLDGGNDGEIGAGRGYLIQTNKAAWMIGTAVEHNVLYGYNVVEAQNVVFSFQQTETPYFQPSPQAPSPWTVNDTYYDPDFTNCDGLDDAKCYVAWPMRVSGGSGIITYGTGFWAFYNDWDDGDYFTHLCGGHVDTPCQLNGLFLENPANSYVFNQNVRGMQNMVLGPEGALALMEHNMGGWGGVLAAYMGFSGG